MLLIVIAFAIGVAIGAFSHKWLAAEVVAATGVQPQAVANAVKSAEQSAAKKV